MSGIELKLLPFKLYGSERERKDSAPANSGRELSIRYVGPVRSDGECFIGL